MIKIMVDSASDCRKEDNLFDLFVPLAINIDGTEYLDGVDIDSDKFYNLLLNADEFPTTSQPATQTFVDIFEQVKADGDELIYFPISSELSGTYQGAVLARTMVDYNKIYIVDSLGATHMIGLLAQVANDMRANGATAKEIVDKCEGLKKKIKVFAGVDTLEYLRKGGRLSNASAIVGELAKVKPIVEVADGKVEAIGKCLGKNRAMQFLLNKVSEYEIDESYPFYSLYTYGTENCEYMEEKLNDAGYKITERRQVGSTIGTHVGPGVYAVLFVTK